MTMARAHRSTCPMNSLVSLHHTLRPLCLFCSVKAARPQGMDRSGDSKNLRKIFAISVGGFSVMDNHLHLLKIFFFFFFFFFFKKKKKKKKKNFFFFFFFFFFLLRPN